MTAYAIIGESEQVDPVTTGLAIRATPQGALCSNLVLFVSFGGLRLATHRSVKSMRYKPL